ncbi:D-glycero-beta-D-manno-heptose 1,7-bisphosphate 7-phosphatase [Thalassomonas actiniarum]|uniref:D,D-heptose 1,7-bisphosphate phosphatase n=1 Tax=Thalassomonas actiniarum TaxID=485447 RepID=A0AAE9YMX9_9GAMM|nr:D-glycero-beta-D-manno-heptose 1,7-bisphosphate 7-phosphatase [Thalassomonas actiniarum]WDD97143.1 D-glycero-beta-D-manno-heptose 1,7-bisphosphate 7-phosphatase [Thalassomonas actiniarum]
MAKALFLDRDGIINIDHGYVHKIDDFEFVGGIFELCQLAAAKGYDIFVITNQAGIARGLYAVADFETLTSWMLAQFKKQGIDIQEVFYCPHHPTKGVNEFKMSCQCRKPAPGMILKAQEKYNIDLGLSIFIGDKPSDMQAAEAAGISSRILVASRYLEEEIKNDSENASNNGAGKQDLTKQSKVIKVNNVLGAIEIIKAL